jgi:hypothetical protein
MERNHLIFTLVFENENTFKKCTKEECNNLLDVSCSMSILNQNIKNSLIKHRVQDLFNKLNDSALKYLFAKQRNDNDTMNLCIDKELDIIQIVKNEKEIVDIFINLLIAEYKELVYGSRFYPHFDKYEYGLLDYFEQTIAQHFTSDGDYEKLLRDHTHDPTHFMFDDGMHFYMFHEMIESKGTKIIDYEDEYTEEYNDEFEEFEEIQDDEDF